jgi:toxin FitB
MKHLALDTSCLVALVSAWHEHHDRVIRAVTSKRAAVLLVVAHTLVESYSVLTRLPARHRLASADALAVLRSNFAEKRVLPATNVWQLLGQAVDNGVAGGHVYDALIAWSAAQATPITLLTLNPRHFADLAVPGLTVEEP